MKIDLPQSGRFDFVDLAPSPTSFLDEVVNGLGKAQKELPAKYFYDERGSQLFEAICETAEYYPTRSEKAIMAEHSAEMAAALGTSVLLIEYGSGSGAKTRMLVDTLDPAAYVAIDISSAALRGFAASLSVAKPDLPIIALCADYTAPLAFPDLSRTGYTRKVVYFPGSTIGNFTREEMFSFLRETCELVSPNGALLVGVDIKKNPAILHAAYNDARGVTAEFNLNVLARINRVLGADFDRAAFWHYAYYNAPMGRIEMHLLSKRVQTVHVAGRSFHFREGETIHTENSCKYEVEEFQQHARRAGFYPARVWTDEARLFSVHLLLAGP